MGAAIVLVIVLSIPWGGGATRVRFVHTLSPALIMRSSRRLGTYFLMQSALAALLFWLALLRLPRHVDSRI